MLDIEDIKKLTEYQVEVFKDVFATKEDVAILDKKMSRMQNTLDGLAKSSKDNQEAIAIQEHKQEQVDSWITKASPKIGIPYKI